MNESESEDEVKEANECPIRCLSTHWQQLSLLLQLDEGEGVEERDKHAIALVILSIDKQIRHIVLYFSHVSH